LLSDLGKLIFRGTSVWLISIAELSVVC
jgi:hypothetical protein